MEKHIQKKKEAHFLRRNTKMMVDALLICKAEQRFKLNSLNIQLVCQCTYARIILILIAHTTKHMGAIPGRAALKTT